MRRALILVASLAVAAGAVALTAGTATAGAPRCVTRAEYRHVHVGTPERTVVRLWHGHGQQSESGRTYRACGGGHVNVDYPYAGPRRVLAKYRIPASAADPLAP